MLYLLSVPHRMIPPPVPLWVFTGFATAATYWWPMHSTVRSPTLGWAILGGAVVWIYWANSTLRKAGTTLDVREDASVLVCEGPFRFSRNPIYLGMLAILLGIAVALGSPWYLLGAVLQFALLRAYYVPREEAYLRQRFGPAFEGYVQVSPRWVALHPMHGRRPA